MQTAEPLTGKIAIYLPAHIEVTMPTVHKRGKNDPRVTIITHNKEVSIKTLYDISKFIVKDAQPNIDYSKYKLRLFQIEMPNASSSRYLQRIRLYINRLQEQHPEACICFVKEYGHKGIFKFDKVPRPYAHKLVLLK